MKKKALSLLLATCMTVSLAACGSSNSSETSKPSSDSDSTKTEKKEEVKTESKEETKTEEVAATGELVDGKFAETRHISVEIYDRGNDGGSDPENNMYTEYIKKGMLEKHNVEVEFKKVPRWTEVDEINNLLAAGDAPDICVTYSYPTVLTYAQMGGVIDLSSLVETYKSETPNLWNWLGEENILWDKDPVDGTLWAIEGKRAETQRICTFVRQDWLDKLNMKAPTTRQEFEDMLVAFKDNATTLLGDEASKMVPFSTSFDIGWRTNNLLYSFIDPQITDKEFYVNGFDDRLLTQNGTKEAVRLLNKWYNMGLIWSDFALYGSGDKTEEDMIKAGYVGSFMNSWDQPFRDGEDSFNSNLKRQVGEDAKFVAVDCFQDSNNKYRKLLYSTAGDRKIFFPITNDEPLASLLYLDFISSPEVIKYLQAGDEGVTHTVLESGAIQITAATGDAIQNSGKNIDYTITCNGTCFGDQDLANLSLAYGYAGADPQLVLDSNAIANTDGVHPININVGVVEAEAGVGDTLSAKRDQLYDSVVVAKEADFDKVWDEMYADYLNAGGQAIMDERAEKWVATYGDVTMKP